MIHVEPIQVGEHTFIGVEVKLPKTTLISISNDRGYIMCGALDVGLLNDRLADRKIIAARAVGVRTLKELLEAPMESVTAEAEALGIHPGLPGYEALLKMV
ncbi:YunC family protein [Paenibacillus terreus]|uniref:YunC family protein n=1 Tax=Paenibacillus terreus TaxID=1387834 RepID=A0ABV5BDW4_9BACL